MTPWRVKKDGTRTSAVLAGLAVWAGIGFELALQAAGAPVASPLSPAAALAAFETEPGLKVELVAAEPLVVDPVAMAFDENGVMMVIENRGYPTGSTNGKPEGLVVRLDDTNGDGRPDRRTVFADGLAFPNGVMPWRGGWIITSSPEVLWFKDANGDGRADVREVWMTGFATNQSTQLRVNDPTLAADGWIYFAGGLSGGRVTSPKFPQSPAVDLGKGDIRFRPDTGEMEVTDGKSQFGLAFDDAGHRFACFNRVHLQHIVAPARYWRRNPHLSWSQVMHNCPADLAANLLMRGGDQSLASPIFPISSNITTADSHAGTYSAACAVHIARGDALPVDYVGRAWTCDPTGNLVRSDRLEAAGGTFRSRRVSPGTEALRSRDDWFRPVFLADAPDGALYVCDMYRKTIEHPEYLPPEVRKRADFESGRGMGRIWKISAAGPEPAGMTSFKGVSIQDVASRLDHPNGWVRDAAFRLLLERGEKSMATALKAAITRDSREPGTILRLRLVEQWGAADESLLVRALSHPFPGVVENAVQLAESRLKGSPRLQQALTDLSRHTSPRVRFQVALSLGELTDHRAAPALAQIAVAAAGDPWTHAAVLSAAVHQPVLLMGTLMRTATVQPDPTPEIFLALGRMLADAVPRPRYVEVFPAALDGNDAHLERQMAFITGFGEKDRTALETPIADQPLMIERVRRIFTRADEILANTNAPLSSRLRAIGVMGLAGERKVYPALLPFLDAGRPPEEQAAVVASIVQPHHPNAAKALIGTNRWNRYAPALQNTILARLLPRPEYHQDVMTALERAVIPLGLMDSGRRDQLRKSKVVDAQLRAAKLFSESSGGDRYKAYEGSKDCLKLSGSATRGREVFLKHCASCHRLNREGVAVGPDLFDIRRQEKESILMHIVVPEHEIMPNFTAYQCETEGGGSFSGLLVNDSAASITLRQAQGVEEVIPRGKIRKLEAARLSLMPQEFEKAISSQEMADLLAYLRGGE